MKFKYQARDREGKIQNGTIEASSEEAVLDILQKNDLYPTSIKEVLPSKTGKIFNRKKVSARNLIDFSRQLSIMIEGGITLLESLKAVANQIENPNFKEIVLEIAEDVEGGMLLSGAFARWPNVFNEFYVSIVRVGESSGELSNSLNYLSRHLERSYDFNSKIKGAMIYPAIVLVLVVGILLMLNLFLIPSMVEFLTEMEKELPMLTKIVIAISAFSQQWWWFIILILIILGYILYSYIKTPEGKKSFDNFCLKLPWIGNFLKKVYISQFSENLSTLISGGIPLIDALDLTKTTIGNVIYQETFLNIIDDIKKGELLNVAVGKYPQLFFPMIQQMILVGERTGSLSKSFKTLSGFYQKEVNKNLNNILNMLEPILMIFLGLIVGIVMAAVMFPLYQMSSL